MTKNGKLPKWIGSIIVCHRYKRPSESSTAARYTSQLREVVIQNKTPAAALESRREQFANLLRPHARHDKRGDAMLDLGDGWRRYTIAANAPENVFDAVQGMDILYLLSQPKLRRSEVMQLMFKLGYLVQFLEGVRAVESLANKGWEITESRRCGGKATAKWTPQVASHARKIFAQEKRLNVSDDAAYRRTAAKLKAEQGISISKDTLRRRLSDSISQR